MSMETWTKYDYGTSLRPGYKVRFVSWGKLAGQEGIFVKQLQKNLSINVEGRMWRVPPGMISEFQSTITPISEIKTNVDTSAARFYKEASEDDVVLMWRGKFDVMKVVSVKDCRCEALDGRGKGTIYRCQPDTFVQVLNSERIKL